MRLLLTILLIFTVTILSGQPPKSDADVIGVFQRLVDKLSSCATIKYNYHRSINYFSENIHSETDGTIFLDFESGDTIIGFKYQVENNDYKSIYNGAELFTLNKKDKTIRVNYDPQVSQIEYESLFTNSIVTLKNALPKIISDVEVPKTIADTILNGESYYLASFVLQNKTLGGLGDFYPITLKRNFLYRIILDKASYLPIQVLVTNDSEPRDYVQTIFSQFRLNTNNPPDISWYHSTYSDNYEPVADRKITLINQNAKAPDWKTVVFNSKDSITLHDMKDHIVLLEFWIKNCGYCISAVPKLNSLIEKYKGEKLRVLGINQHDTKDDIQFFYEANQPNFKTVVDQGGSISANYGISYFPTVVLINKTGLVMYSGPFDQTVLDSLLEKSFDKGSR